MKSDFALAPLSAAAIDVIVRFMTVAPSRDDDIQFQAWGGAINRVPATATAFPHRAGTLFLMQYISLWTDRGDAPTSLRWINEFYAAMRPYVSGYAYATLCDLDLTDWPEAYYGANFPALVA